MTKDFKSYLLEAFSYSQSAGLKQMELVSILPQPDTALTLASHLINAQNRWLQRLEYPKPVTQDAFLPLYSADQWPRLWSESCELWKTTIQSRTADELEAKITYLTPENTLYSIKFSDICLQLIYHNIHHRGQIQVLIRQQGFVPPAIDYFRTVYEPA